ncbi:hypothetical protein D3C72_1951130 [compost metagenome]
MRAVALASAWRAMASISTKSPSSKAVMARFRSAKISSSFAPISCAIRRLLANESSAPRWSPSMFWAVPRKLYEFTSAILSSSSERIATEAFRSITPSATLSGSEAT